MDIRTRQREVATRKIARHLLKTGLSRSSLRQLAAAASTSDRMLLYYFADKEDVLATAIEHLAGQLTEKLAAAIPEGTRLPPGQLVVRIAEITSREEIRPYLRLGVEVLAAAAKKQAPFDRLSKGIVQGFQLWTMSHLIVPEGADAEGVATTILAFVDGLALIEIALGGDLAKRSIDAISLFATEG